MTDRCKTHFPIVLVHGAGFRDLRWPLYWGRIPSALAACGAQVFYGLQDAWGSAETNAAALAARIAQITEEADSAAALSLSVAGSYVSVLLKVYGGSL